ncbi:MAG: flagellin [Steroidobacteraceae bacterium]
MPLTLNTNIDSLTAQNNLTTSQSLLSQSLTRLSSGLRINSAADDAAGLAIGQQFTTQINGTNQAINNANDAVSEAQTAAGALTTIVNNLQSIRTLAVESANGSNSAADRAALDSQVQQQIAEITQIAAQTTFNGSNVLNGTAGTTVYQVGANVGDTIAVDLSTGVEANQIGQFASITGVGNGVALAAGDLTLAVNGGTAAAIGATSAGSGNAVGQANGSAYSVVQAINAAGIQGLTASASTKTAALTITNVGTTGALAGNYQLVINGINVFGATGLALAASNANQLTQAQLQTAINNVSAQTGVTADSQAAGGALELQAADGSTITYTQTLGANTAGGITGATSGTAYSTYGTVSLSASTSITVGGTAPGTSFVSGVAAGLTSLNTAPLSSQNVLTVAGANNTIQSVDSALASVSALQSTLGAIQNRFTSAVSNLTSTAQNLTQSRSTIVDANFAQETANLTQAQVLEQAGISVLAQANQEPQLILKLLQ